MSSIRRFDLEAGGDSFSFKAETEEKIAFWLSKYPDDRKRSAVIPLLWLAQKDNKGWLSEPAMRAVADRLGMSYIRVYEVATFYTMFRMRPVGEHHIQVCGTTPCMLRGSEGLMEICKKKIGPKGHVGAAGKLSWEEVECLGACVNAPMAQVNDYYFEDLDSESFEQLLDDLVTGKDPAPGTRKDRITSAPEGGLTTLLDDVLYDGSRAEPLARIPGAPEPEAAAEVVSTPGKPVEPEPTPPNKVEATKAAVAVQSNPEKPEASFGATQSFVKTETAPQPSLDSDARPSAIENPSQSEKDDLKLISGVGPKIEGILNEIGIYNFAQIAQWTVENVEWVDAYLSFKGRIDRENWIAQAKTLATGGETEFSKRQSSVNEGE